jgi:hypothetical protein
VTVAAAVTVTDDMRCSTEGSAGVVLSDLRKEMSPGASCAMPCAMRAECAGSSGCEGGFDGERWAAVGVGLHYRRGAIGGGSSARRVREQAQAGRWTLCFAGISVYTRGRHEEGAHGALQCCGRKSTSRL